MATDGQLSGIEHIRGILQRVVAGLGPDDLDRQVFPDSKTIGEILLHVAGFEHLIVTCAQWQRRPRLADAESAWPLLKPGFAREAGFRPPRGHRLEDYLGWLSATRDRTLTFLADDAAPAIRAKDFPIAPVAAALHARHPDDDAACYRRLALGIQSSFADDGVVDHRGLVAVQALLGLHETYHRGQITLSKYILSRLRR